MALGVVRSIGMDMEQQWRQEQSHHHNSLDEGEGGQQQQGAASLEAMSMSMMATALMSEQRPTVPRAPRADTPCPVARQANRRGASFVLLPDGAGYANRRLIQLGLGTTVVGRCKSSGIRDHHVSRRHVEVTVPEEGEGGFTEKSCRIKYIGRNCRVVLVGGILLKAEQEVAAGPGTKVILNFNNKGLPRYSYTLVPADNLPMLSAMMAGRRAASGTAGRWRGQPPPSSLLLRTLPLPVPPSEAVVVARQQQQQQQQQPQRNNNQRSLKQKQRPGRFRKEAQDKLQKERDEIFSRFADLKFL